MGALIAMLGLAVIMFGEPKTRQGLNIGVFFAAIMVLCIPHALIGGCGMMSMACRKTAFPAITLIGAVLLLYSMLGAIYLERPQEKSEKI